MIARIPCRDLMLSGGRMTGADVAAMITAAGGSIAAVLGGVALLRRKSGEIAQQERAECEECMTRRRALLRWVHKLLDLLAENGIPEPEGIDDELGLRRAAARSDADA